MEEKHHWFPHPVKRWRLTELGARIAALNLALANFAGVHNEFAIPMQAWLCRLYPRKRASMPTYRHAANTLEGVEWDISQCPPRVNRVTLAVCRSLPVCTQLRTCRCAAITDAMFGRLQVGKDLLHVLQHWSVQSCVRPFNAVHMTAGHNALRGSGPDQQLAFKNAMTQWVVLIAGSTGSALRAVRPPNLNITPVVRRGILRILG